MAKRAPHHRPTSSSVDNGAKHMTAVIQSAPRPTLFQIAASIDNLEFPMAVEPLHPQSGKESASTKPNTGAPIQSPTRLVGFHLHAPSAESVVLAADFTNWEKSAVSMTRRADGFWLTCLPLAPGNYAYRFVVDGQWCDDPSCLQHVPNPFGTTNAVITVV